MFFTKRGINDKNEKNFLSYLTLYKPDQSTKIEARTLGINSFLPHSYCLFFFLCSCLYFIFIITLCLFYFQFSYFKITFILLFFYFILLQFFSFLIFFNYV